MIASARVASLLACSLSFGCVGGSRETACSPRAMRVVRRSWSRPISHPGTARSTSPRTAPSPTPLSRCFMASWMGASISEAVTPSTCSTPRRDAPTGSPADAQPLVDMPRTCAFVAARYIGRVVRVPQKEGEAMAGSEGYPHRAVLSSPSRRSMSERSERSCEGPASAPSRSRCAGLGRCTGFDHGIRPTRSELDLPSPELDHGPAHEDAAIGVDLEVQVRGASDHLALDQPNRQGRVPPLEEPPA